MNDRFDYFSITRDDISEANELLRAQHELNEDYDRYHDVSNGLEGIVGTSNGSYRTSRADKKRLRSGEWLNELVGRKKALWDSFVEAKGVLVIDEAYNEKRRRDAASQALGKVAYRATEDQLGTIEEFISLKRNEHYLRQLRERNIKVRDVAEIAIAETDDSLATMERLQLEIDGFSGEN